MMIAVLGAAIVALVILALVGVMMYRSRQSAPAGRAARQPAARQAAPPMPATRPPSAAPTTRPASAAPSARPPAAAPTTRPQSTAPAAPAQRAPPATRQPAARTAREAPAGPVAIARPRAATATPTVLIVDDSPIMRRTLMTLFGKAGYQTASAGGGAEALLWVRGNGMPGLVTLDMEMPGMDGLQTLDALRALDGDRSMQAVFVTSRMQSERARETATQLGAIAFFSKPYDPADLIALANRVAPLA